MTLNSLFAHSGHQTLDFSFQLDHMELLSSFLSCFCFRIFIIRTVFAYILLIVQVSCMASFSFSEVFFFSGLKDIILLLLQRV